MRIETKHEVMPCEDTAPLHDQVDRNHCRRLAASCKLRAPEMCPTVGCSSGADVGTTPVPFTG